MKPSRNDLIGVVIALIGLVAAVLLLPGVATLRGPAPLRVLFGWGAYFAVPALILGGIAAAFAGPLRWTVRWQAVACAELLFLAALGVLHLGEPRAMAAAFAGQGGGLVGWGISAPLADLLGALGARLVLWAGIIAAAWALWRSLPAGWTGGAGAANRGPGYLIRVQAQRVGRALVGGSAGAVAGAGPLKNVTSAGRRSGIPGGPSADVGSALAGRIERFFGWIALSARVAALGQRLRDGLGAIRSLPSRLRRGRPVEPEALPAPEAPSRLSVAPRRAARVAAADEPTVAAKPARTGKAEEPAPGRKTRRPAGLPPMDLLRLDQGNGGPNTDARHRAQLIKQTLGEFGVPIEIVSIKEGPTVTQFGLEPGEYVRELRGGEVLRRRVPVSAILRLNNDLALALAAPSLRIEAPVPGRPYVGIEVPNVAKTMVGLRNILESKEFARVGSPLTVALGRDVSGDPVVADLTRMPHLLIAGATGSGKSVCINAIICSLLMNNAPESIRVLMVDPKMVELPGYNGIPHLVGPVITDPAHATGALAWLMLQMDDRYRMFADRGARNIVEYNHKMSHSQDRLPYLVLVIDELADLMMTAADDIERQICRLAQMARATGIHLVLATQRPSVDVITGLIKANFPARVAFAVTSQIDSRVILDTPGAEKLLGRGDMLFMAPDTSKLARIQGCFVSDKEIEAVVSFWKAQNDGAEAPTAPAPWEGLVGGAGEERDELLDQALKLVATKTHISTSLLQRQLRIGFPRAARLMEQLEELGYVGADEGGGRSREVIMRSD